MDPMTTFNMEPPQLPITSDCGLVLRESVAASNIGGTLLLKLCGFIQTEQARFLEVSDDCFCLRIGHGRFERFWHGLKGHDPLRVTLHLRHAAAGDLPRASRAAQTLVDVEIRPESRRWRPETFDSCARHILRRLKLHLMAN